MECSVNQRIRLFIDYLGINDNQFAKNICITQSVIASMFSRKTEPSTKVITAILNTYANLSAEWLLRGEGNMIKHENANETIHESAKYNAEVQIGEDGYLKIKIKDFISK